MLVLIFDMKVARITFERFWSQNDCSSFFAFALVIIGLHLFSIFQPFKKPFFNHLKHFKNLHLKTKGSAKVFYPIEQNLGGD